MKKEKRFKINFKVKGALLSIFMCCTVLNCGHPKDKNTQYTQDKAVLETGQIKSTETGAKWSRCFLSGDGIIYFQDSLMSLDGGRTLIKQEG